MAVPDPVAAVRLAGFSARYLTFKQTGSERQFSTHSGSSSLQSRSPQADSQRALKKVVGDNYLGRSTTTILAG
jgi:hypothetical protein